MGSAGSACRIIHINHRPDHVRSLGFKGAILIEPLTPQYVAREIQKKLPVSYLKVQRYAERNADKLKAKAKLERERGVNAHTLQ